MFQITTNFFFKLTGNGWYMLSGRISESVPVRRTRNCETGIRGWRPTNPALQYVLCYGQLFFLFILFKFSPPVKNYCQ